jgi:hypothetical protein
MQLWDHEGKEEHDQAETEKGREEKEALEKMFPPLAYDVVRDDLEQPRILPSKDGRKNPIHICVSGHR